MPELPEVETIRRELEPTLLNQTISTVQTSPYQLRFPYPQHLRQTLTQNSITKLHRHGKYLLIDLKSATTLICHLGMSGSFKTIIHHPTIPPQLNPHDHFAITLRPQQHTDKNTASIIYHDPRRFGFIHLTASPYSWPPLAKLGYDPLNTPLSAPELARYLATKITPNSPKSIKTLLLDQTIIAGIGNIYAAEILFHAKISPLTPASQLQRRRQYENNPLNQIARAIPIILNEALNAGGSTLKDHSRPQGQTGYFQHKFNVYDRHQQPCNTNPKHIIQRIKQNGRSTFYCPKCQK